MGEWVRGWGWGIEAPFLKLQRTHSSKPPRTPSLHMKNSSVLVAYLGITYIDLINLRLFRMISKNFYFPNTLKSKSSPKLLYIKHPIRKRHFIKHLNCFTFSNVQISFWVLSVLFVKCKLIDLHVFTTIVLNFFKMQIQNFQVEGVRVAKRVKGNWGLTESSNYKHISPIDCILVYFWNPRPKSPLTKSWLLVYNIWN